jgi:hypothetical protein
MADCIICGRPEYMTVDERPFCQEHGEGLLGSIERTIDWFRGRHRQSISPRTKFVTIGEFIDEAVRSGK